MKWNLKPLAILGGLAVAGASLATPPVVDGYLDAVYGPPVALNDTQTQFGDNTADISPWATGSEINAIYAYRDFDALYLFIPGNLETNYNKLDIFIDRGYGVGQNRLLFGQSDVNFGALKRMAEDPEGAGNGLTFDPNFAPDWWFTVSNGDGGGYTAWYDHAQIGNPEFVNGYLGYNFGSGPLSGGTNPFNFEGAVNNGNTYGVEGGTWLTASALTGLERGVEIKIPLSMIGAEGPIKVCAFVNGGGHDYVSNQFPTGIVGGRNLSSDNFGNYVDVRNLNLGLVNHDQYVVVPPYTQEPMGTVTGKVVLPGTPNPNWISMVFRRLPTGQSDGGAQEYATVNAQLDASGNFTVMAPGQGVWELTTKFRSNLRRTVLVDTSNGSATGVELKLLAGDIDRDEAITVFDYNYLSENFDKTSDDPAWYDADANGIRPIDSDLDFDGAVTVFDYNLLSENFDMVGDA